MPLENGLKYRNILTCGTFDLFHLGHLNQLLRASTLDNSLPDATLTVGVSSDFLNVKKKGRLPVVPLHHRIQIIKSLKCVNQVFVEEEYDTDSKRVYSKWYGTDIFTIGDDWQGRFDDLQGLGNIQRVQYIPRTPQLSTTQTVKVLGQQQELDLSRLKPVLTSQARSTLPSRVFFDTDLANLQTVLPFVGLFKPSNIYWPPMLWSDPDFQQINSFQIGKPLNSADRYDLVLTTAALPNSSTTAPVVSISRDSDGYCLNQGSHHILKKMAGGPKGGCEASACPLKIPVTYELIASKSAEIVWIMNQRLNEQHTPRTNVLVKLNERNLVGYSEQIVDLTRKHNLIIALDRTSHGLDAPHSAVSRIFWATLECQTGDFLTVLPKNFYIHMPNVLHDCDVLLTDTTNNLAENSLSRVVTVNLNEGGMLGARPRESNEVAKRFADKPSGQHAGPPHNPPATFQRALQEAVEWDTRVKQYFWGNLGSPITPSFLGK